MRYLTVIFIFFNTIGQAQHSRLNNSFPFQVVYAEDARTTSGRELKSLDLISFEDIVTVADGGTLVMIHYNNFPVQVDGDSTIVISTLEKRLMVQEDDKKKKKVSANSSRPYIRRLFITNDTLARKDKLQRTTICYDCSSDLEILYPPAGYLSKYYFQTELCLKWRHDDPAGYKVLIQSMFDDLLDSSTVTTNEILIDEQRLKTIAANEDLLVITLQGLQNKRLSRSVSLHRLRIDGLEFPFTCEPVNASSALLAGLSLEMQAKEHGAKLMAYYTAAEKYYVLATKLSDRLFYKTMLENFRRRIE
jgi:hypothetical protein